MAEHQASDDTQAGGQAIEPESAAADRGAGPLSGDIRRILFMAASHLLSYPDDAFWQVLPEVTATLREMVDVAPAALLADATALMEECGSFALAIRYVATFDLSEPAALYLTAHEFGESRRRGTELVELRRMLRAAGLQPHAAELPDYLPLLLEFLAHAPEDFAMHGLEQRLAAACDHICSTLSPESPYQLIFRALLSLLPAPTPADDRSRFPLREQADTGVMPYPLRYE